LIAAIQEKDASKLSFQRAARELWPLRGCPITLSPHDLARYFHLDDTDHALIAQKRGAHNRLGFAVQLGTVRYLGTFLEDPLAVPQPVLRMLAQQLCIEVADKPSTYGAGEQRWQHAIEIRASYGYVEITEPLIGFRLTRWLYAICWTGTDRPSVLFERATTWLVTHKVLLPGCTTLERYVARLRSRVEERLWRSLGSGISLDQKTKLEGLLISSGGSRKSQLDRLRTGPVMASSRSMNLALMRLQAVRELGIRLPAATRIPATRIAALARFAGAATILPSFVRIGANPRQCTLRPCRLCIFVKSYETLVSFV
jgi:hypothetical protein